MSRFLWFSVYFTYSLLFIVNDSSVPFIFSTQLFILFLIYD